MLVEKLIEKGGSHRVSTWRGFLILQLKHTRIYWRNKSGFYLRIRLGIAALIFCSILFWDCGYDRAGIQNRKGCLFFIMIYSSIANLQAAASNLNNGISVLKKELTEGQYSVSSFFLAKTFAGSIPSLVLVSLVCNLIHFLANLNRTSRRKMI